MRSGEKLLPLNLVIPGLCGPLPEIESLNSESVQSVLSWLAKADRQSIAQKTFYDVLAKLFAIDADKPFPAAALSLLASGQYDEQGHWFRIDPVHLQTDMDHAILRDTHGLDLSLDESAALLAELNVHFHEDGIRFVMIDKDSWCLHVAGDERVATTPVTEVISRNVYSFMPQGEDALFWKKIMNEVQMLLHHSPVNRQREQQRQLPVNGAWLWGGGALPNQTPLRITNIYGQQPLLSGLAVLNGLSCQPLSELVNHPENMAQAAGAIVVLDDLFQLTCYGDVAAWQTAFDTLYENYLQPLLKAAMNNKIKVDVYACNGVCYHIAANNRFRFFRDKRRQSYIDTYE